METKLCGKCKESKSLCEFTKDKNRKDGLFVYCKECKKKVSKEEYLKNKKRIFDYQKNYYKENTEKILDRVKKDYLSKKETKLNYQKKYYEDNLEKKLNYSKIYRQKNKEKRRKYENERKKTDPIYKLKHLVRNRITKFISQKKISKKIRTFEIVGCEPEKLKIFLEQKFVEGMTWENQGKWHIDHIIPLSSAKTEEELYNLCHYTNLQPMWAIENIKKGSKII